MSDLRVPVSERPLLLELSSELLRQLLADCSRRAPAEACGALIGRMCNTDAIEDNESCSTVEAISVCVLPNRATHAETEYCIAPADVLRLEREARAQNATIVGFYHSHPGGAPEPSTRDLESAWPGYIYLIAGTCTGSPCLRGWRLRDDRTGFDSVEVSCRS